METRHIQRIAVGKKYRAAAGWQNGAMFDHRQDRLSKKVVRSNGNGVGTEIVGPTASVQSELCDVSKRRVCDVMQVVDERSGGGVRIAHRVHTEGIDQTFTDGVPARTTLRLALGDDCGVPAGRDEIEERRLFGS